MELKNNENHRVLGNYQSHFVINASVYSFLIGVKHVPMNDLTTTVLNSVLTNREQNVGHCNQKINERFGIRSNHERFGY